MGGLLEPGRSNVWIACSGHGRFTVVGESQPLAWAIGENRDAKKHGPECQHSKCDTEQSKQAYARTVLAIGVRQHYLGIAVMRVLLLRLRIDRAAGGGTARLVRDTPLRR